MTGTENTRTERKGQCLCGAVKLTVKPADNHIGACHCAMCRRWGGGPLMALDCGTDAVIDGEENMTVYDSSLWAERAFCSTCGTNLFYRVKETGQIMAPAGLFDDTDGFALTNQIFIDEKPGFYTFAEETENMTGAEVFAMFAPSA